MIIIEERDIKLEANSGRYHLLKRLFLIGIILFVITFISTTFIAERISNAAEMEMMAIWAIFICFILYKWANAKIQHIESVRYYKNIMETTANNTFKSLCKKCTARTRIKRRAV